MMNDPLVLLLGTWADDLTPAGILLRIGLAVGLSGIIGWERARKRHSAGLRTFILITLGAAVVMIGSGGQRQIGESEDDAAHDTAHGVPVVFRENHAADGFLVGSFPLPHSSWCSPC